MTLAEVLGFVGGAIGMFQALPQARRVRSLGHGRGVSLATWVLTFVVGASWFGYGIREASPAVFVTNFVSTLITGSVVAALVGTESRPLMWLPVFGLAVVGLVQVLPSALLSAFLVALTASRTPQVLKSFRNRREGHPTAVSISALMVGIASLLCWEGFGLLSHRPLMLVTTTIAITLSAAIALLEFTAPHAVAARITDSNAVATSTRQG